MRPHTLKYRMVHTLKVECLLPDTVVKLVREDDAGLQCASPGDFATFWTLKAPDILKDALSNDILANMSPKLDAGMEGRRLSGRLLQAHALFNQEFESEAKHRAL